MRIAFFTPYLPYPPDTGGKIRSYHLLRALAASFEVDLYTVHHGKAPPDGDIKALQEYCRQVVLFCLEKSWRINDRISRVFALLPHSVDYFRTPDSLRLAHQYIREARHDLVVADEICVTPYAELAPDLPRIVIRQKVDHRHYLETALARPWGLEKVLGFVEAFKLRRYEQVKMPFYQACVACSEQDAALIALSAPSVPFRVIPNGVDLSTFLPSGYMKTSRSTILYVGAMDYYPNVDAVQFFFKTMYDQITKKMPDLRIQIVGQAPPLEVQRLSGLPHVEVVGRVPDVRPYYEQATVAIVPLRLGGGTHLKIVEAMAMGLPVVSTTVGAEGLDVHPGEDILLADDPALFADGVLRLFQDQRLRERIAAGGRRLAQRYDWGELTKSFADLAKLVVEEWRHTGAEKECV